MYALCHRDTEELCFLVSRGNSANYAPQGSAGLRMVALVKILKHNLLENKTRCPPHLSSDSLAVLTPGATESCGPLDTQVGFHSCLLGLCQEHFHRRN